MRSRLNKAAVKDRRFRRIRLLDNADIGQSVGHLFIDRVRHVAIVTEQFELGDVEVVGVGTILRVL